MSAKSANASPRREHRGNPEAGARCRAGTGLARDSRENDMALPHASLLDVIDIRPLGPALHDAVSTSLLKTDRLQLLHLVLPASQPYSLSARVDSAVLMTLLLRHGDAGDSGGRQAP